MMMVGTTMVAIGFAFTTYATHLKIAKFQNLHHQTRKKNYFKMEIVAQFSDFLNNFQAY